MADVNQITGEKTSSRPDKDMHISQTVQDNKMVHRFEIRILNFETGGQKR